MNDGVIHPIIFQQNGKEVMKVDSTRTMSSLTQINLVNSQNYKSFLNGNGLSFDDPTYTGGYETSINYRGVMAREGTFVTSIDIPIKDKPGYICSLKWDKVLGKAVCN